MPLSLATVLALILAVVMTPPVVAAPQLPDTGTLQQWIQQMKSAPRGPFRRIRWFCADGAILPPEPYACVERGGGAQHGQWSERTRRLRAGGYYIANILADMDPDPIAQAAGRSDLLNQMLIEQFLIAIDDGWILRAARYYRGAFQEQGELAGARRLLLAMAGKQEWVTRGYLPLRVSAALLPHRENTGSAMATRQLSLTMSEKDDAFIPLRNKLHNKPDANDAQRVREYAANLDDPALITEYERLATLLDKLYTSDSAIQNLRRLSARLPADDELVEKIRHCKTVLTASQNAAAKLAATAQLMAELRDRIPGFENPVLRLHALDTSLALEAEHFVAATELRDQLPGISRGERLRWLRDGALAAYGTALISAREWRFLQSVFNRLETGQVSLASYRAALDDLMRVPAWGNQWLRFHFAASISKLGEVEPLSQRFIQDQLRGGPLFFYANVLESLARDANALGGRRNQLFGEPVGAGLRSLNPGLARGILRDGKLAGEAGFRRDGIYLLPETIADLPPVAGILTAGEGNPLSHIQLLARNLGIPNVSVDENLVPRLQQYTGKPVVLAVSPGGTVQLTLDNGSLDSLLETDQLPDRLIRPDLDKLDLTTTDFIPLSRLRARDSGRIVGPKAAKLGELHHHYPEAVADGLAIPFGAFRKLLDQPMQSGDDQSVFNWMLEWYESLAAMDPGSPARTRATEIFRKKLEQRILRADPGEPFLSGLWESMQRMFGDEDTYGVFVRSDTNVEDLPGFTGAGLNLTVANAVGFDDIVAAISRVWASPFSRRAFAWRQLHMESPEHVYPAVLLMRSVPVEKSGVMVTRDIDTGDPGWLSVAVNEGVGGAVDGQAAESLRINVFTGEVRLLADATAPLRRVLRTQGGIAKVPVSGEVQVLTAGEIAQLTGFARDLPHRFPHIYGAVGELTAADVEFGFVGGKLMLFQIRPFLESKRARSNAYLQALDRRVSPSAKSLISMEAIPAEASL